MRYIYIYDIDICVWVYRYTPIFRTPASKYGSMGDPWIQLRSGPDLCHVTHGHAVDPGQRSQPQRRGCDSDKRALRAKKSVGYIIDTYDWIHT